MLDAHAKLVEAGLLPAEMPKNFTYNKVRTILAELEKADPSSFDEAVKAAKAMSLSGPQALAIFIKHHLAGAHTVEVDRVASNEEQGTSYAVLIYPEGEVPVRVDCLPDGVEEGKSLRYNPAEGKYTA